MSGLGFVEAFGSEPEVRAEAPGRVNLLGEHTDYNEGYVLPIAIGACTTAAVAKSRGSAIRLYSANLDERCDFTLDAPLPAAAFARYVYGCLQKLREHGVELPALDVFVDSEVPIGVGLSSSAALEVALLRAMRELLRFALDDVALARMAQRAEIEFAGVNCGIMDQMACSLADREHMLFLDAGTLAWQLLPLPAGAEVLVVDSGMSRSLAASKYNERRRQCEDAARLLGVSSLREVADVSTVERLPDPLRKRARHVVSENARVLQAIAAQDAQHFGELMNASQRSLALDYEVSIPELDALVAILQSDSCVYGAKLTGAGFGGACVALCQRSHAAQAGARALKAYRSAYGTRVSLARLVH